MPVLELVRRIVPLPNSTELPVTISRSILSGCVSFGSSIVVKLPACIL